MSDASILIDLAPAERRRLGSILGVAMGADFARLLSQKLPGTVAAAEATRRLASRVVLGSGAAMLAVWFASGIIQSLTERTSFISGATYGASISFLLILLAVFAWERTVTRPLRELAWHSYGVRLSVSGRHMVARVPKKPMSLPADEFIETQHVLRSY